MDGGGLIVVVGGGTRRQAHRVLRIAVRESGWSLERAAFELGVSRSTFFRWLSGDWKPTLRHAIMIEQVFEIPVETWNDNDGAT